MNKQEFLAQLKCSLSGLPYSDTAQWLNFYSEMIDDRIEEGLTEEQAVQAVGSVEKIAMQILSETAPLPEAVHKTKAKKTLQDWQLLLLVLGSPLWLALLLAAFAVIVSLFASLWSVVISFWAVFVSVGVSAFALAAVGIVFICIGYALEGIAMAAAGMVCAGLTILLFFGCKWISKSAVFLTKLPFVRWRMRNE